MHRTYKVNLQSFIIELYSRRLQAACGMPFESLCKVCRRLDNVIGNIKYEIAALSFRLRNRRLTVQRSPGRDLVRSKADSLQSCAVPVASVSSVSCTLEVFRCRRLRVLAVDCSGKASNSVLINGEAWAGTSIRWLA